MKQLEALMGWITFLLFAATGVLALVWVAFIAYSALTGAKNLPVETAGAIEDAPAETEPAETAEAEPREPAAAATLVSAEAGEKVFKKCKACHDAAADGKNKTGPNLWGVVGASVASVEGFGYSDAFTDLAGQTWDVVRLQGYLENPRKYAPGTTMAFAGLKEPDDRNNVIVYLAGQSDTPVDAKSLGFGAAAAAAGKSPATEDSGATGEAVVEIDPVPYPEGVSYRNPPALGAQDQAEIDARVAALEKLVPTLDYERARYHPLHFPPAAARASNAECLVCHREILDHEVRDASPAGVPASDTIAWYQTLDTYEGQQQSFHYRHLESDFARQVMNLSCSFCHKGTDPREESPDMVPTRANLTAPAVPEFTLRKVVNTTTTCLRCHGAMPEPEIMGLSGPWHEVREDMEWPEASNGCLSCHAESFRTVRHNVTYLKAETIEEQARQGSSDSCYGCHGGRAWYRIPYPYPRSPWPTMFEDEVPDWARGRPEGPDPDYALPAAE